MAEEEKKDREFKWGENVFTHMPEPELRQHATRMYDALDAARGTLEQLRYFDHFSNPNHPYWRPGGSGEQSFAKAHQAIDKLGLSEQEKENQYRSFYRYNDQFLYEVGSAAVLTAWQVLAEPQHGLDLVGVHLSDALYERDQQGLPPFKGFDEIRHLLKKDAHWYTEEEFKNPTPAAE